MSDDGDEVVFVRSDGIVNIYKELRRAYVRRGSCVSDVVLSRQNKQVVVYLRRLSFNNTADTSVTACVQNTWEDTIHRVGYTLLFVRGVAPSGRSCSCF